MKKRPKNSRDWHERRLEAARYQDVPRISDTRASKAAPGTGRTKKRAVAVGLANEPRPGLGTRVSVAKLAKAKPKKPAAKRTKKKSPRSKSPHDKEPLGRVAPLPPTEPREQDADSYAHEEERDTGVSGHSSAD